MFTGIISHQGKINAIQAVEQGLEFTIGTQFDHLILGESITVDGACLTVVNPQPHQFRMQLSRETLDKTIANTYQVGTVVNLERAMSAADRFGGHYVTGHVEQVATVSDIKLIGECTEIYFSGIELSYQNYLIDKGSICINGVSLTINKVLPSGFVVMLIPHTLEITNLKQLRKNSNVNIEFDWMVKVIIGKMQIMKEQLCNA